VHLCKPVVSKTDRFLLTAKIQKLRRAFFSEKISPEKFCGYDNYEIDGEIYGTNNKKNEFAEDLRRGQFAAKCSSSNAPK
ncbi:hypothetical protein ACSNOK_34230, partial [Streptomyces sp. URMC 126]|uniref:hypothetical protein n=1 Tax=Streptomyces sp. URMC 126 TaxID=3423401 RepID=UPI003F1D9DC4